jgi:adenylate kinase
VIVWVAGTPGVGKTTVGRLLAKRLGYGFTDLPEVVRRMGLGEHDPESGAVLVTSRTVRMIVEKYVADNSVLSSHLVVRVSGRRVVCIVLRLNPLVLVKRLRRRGYGVAKVLENVEAEFVGAVYSDAVRAFGRRNVFQLDVTGIRANAAAGKCLRILEGDWGGDDVDWLSDLPKKQMERLLGLFAKSRLGSA